jgi:hemoglobin-like flavoprotein
LELVEQLSLLFEGSTRAHGIFNISNENNSQKQQGVAKTIKTIGANLDNWKSHLEGSIGLGIIPINENNQVKWGLLM